MRTWLTKEDKARELDLAAQRAAKRIKLIPGAGLTIEDIKKSLSRRTPAGDGTYIEDIYLVGSTLHEKVKINLGGGSGGVRTFFWDRVRDDTDNTPGRG